jgi:hypothetical protein
MRVDKALLGAGVVVALVGVLACSSGSGGSAGNDSGSDAVTDGSMASEDGTSGDVMPAESS